ncbi:sulfur carrier protein ThiS [Nocardia pseudobrasiliensis]|uniref:Sulfur carrier protein n=1 Tax=Nocardia pseudobrasiliensis TaxID=45979 RepID=A0A370HRX8_9NOCA|nr:sulfur carrier protein ThiS [Nocardia pseudobrasiliensis]RDI59684.1 sulfur carrier protein [Nocardia pseudobrasiliensis]
MTAIPVGVTVNGQDHEFAHAPTVRELLERLNLPCQGVAVAVDGAVFPKSSWDRPVERGWEIEVLTAVQGG